MAGSTPDPPLKVFLFTFLFSGTGCSSVRVVHLTGEYFGIISEHCFRWGNKWNRIKDGLFKEKNKEKKDCRIRYTAELDTHSLTYSLSKDTRKRKEKPDNGASKYHNH